jgi:glycosyltransferase involved in cell wall biosynthesis
MTSPVLFSIVIPTYNRADLILDTLNSVFQQTFTNYEVIVVDNCSTDNTEEILDSYIKDGTIKFIKHEKNYERARSRNTGMENATGKFVTFLDSDDFMYRNNLADAAEFVANNPDIKCFHNLYELLNSEKKVLRKYTFPPLDNQLTAIVAGNFMSCIGNFIHRDIYSNFRFDTFSELTGAEDWEFWLRVFAEHRLGRISKINSGIRHHHGRTVKSKHFEALEQGYLYMFDKFRKDQRLMATYANHMKRIEANSYLYLAVLANTGAHFHEARRYLKLARQTDPSVILTFRFVNVCRRAFLKLQIKT